MSAEVDQFVDVVEGEGAALSSVGWGYILRCGRSAGIRSWRRGESPGERAQMSIHLSSERGSVRRVVLSCDAAGCPVQLEPSAIERWRSDADALSFARSHAVGWTHDPVRQADYCLEHADLSTALSDVVPPRPTAAARDKAGNPLNRDEYAVILRARLAEDGGSTERTTALTGAQVAVAISLLEELAGVYRGEDLGTLATELSVLLDGQVGKQAERGM